MRDVEFFTKLYAPVTEVVAFIEAPVDKIELRMREHVNEVGSGYNWHWPKTPTPGPLAAILERHPPTRLGPKELLIGTKSPWTAYFVLKEMPDMSVADYYAKALNARIVIIVFIEPNRYTPHGSFQFVYQAFSPSGQPTNRSVSVHQETKVWEFKQWGDPLPFEEIGAYSAKLKRDRLNIDMIERYCRHLGIELFDPEFYCGPAFIVEAYWGGKKIPSSYYKDRI
jgi:hypothetical protein